MRGGVRRGSELVPRRRPWFRHVPRRPARAHDVHPSEEGRLSIALAFPVADCSGCASDDGRSAPVGLVPGGAFSGRPRMDEDRQHSSPRRATATVTYVKAAEDDRPHHPIGHIAGCTVALIDHAMIVFGMGRPIAHEVPRYAVGLPDPAVRPTLQPACWFAYGDDRIGRYDPMDDEFGYALNHDRHDRSKWGYRSPNRLSGWMGPWL